MADKYVFSGNSFSKQQIFVLDSSGERWMRIMTATQLCVNIKGFIFNCCLQLHSQSSPLYRLAVTKVTILVMTIIKI